MEEELIFQMGKFKARIPRDLLYTKNHLWVRKEDVSTVGITHYQQRFFMDVEDISFSLHPGDGLPKGGQLATVEGVKAVAEIVADFQGQVVELNEELDIDPTLINASPYLDGWLIKVRDLEGDLMSPVEYLDLIKQDWEDTVEQIVQERGDGKILPPL
jgi:glycine cleavage system H protein